MNVKEEIIRLGQKCYDCQECPLGKCLVDGMDPHVFGVGKAPCNVMFIAEAPGRDEVIQRKPLVGRSGQFFNNKILAVAGLKRENVYITNTVLCRPDGNRNPLPAEIKLCQPFLEKQIELVDPKLLVTLGNIPLFSVCETIGITKKRGKVILSREWSNGSKIPVFPMFHPSYCIRGSGLKETESDAKTVGKLVRAM